MDDKERIAVLETQHKQLMDELGEMHNDLREVKKAVTSWRGVMLGVALTVSFIWTGIMGAWNIFKHKVGA